MSKSNSLNNATTGLMANNGGTFTGRTIVTGDSVISVTNGDGVSGNPTISSTGISSSSSQASTIVYIDDMMMAGAATATTGGGGIFPWDINVEGASVVNAFSVLSEAGHPGIVGVNNFVTDSIENSCIACTSQGVGIILGAGDFEINFWAKVPTLSTGTQRFELSIGLADATDGGAPVDQQNGCYFRYADNVNSGKWQIVTANAGTRSTSDSGIAADTNWHKFSVIANAAGSSISFYIDDVQTSNSPINSNIPTVALGPFFCINKTVGGTTRNFYVDLVTMKYALTTPR